MESKVLLVMSVLLAKKDTKDSKGIVEPQVFEEGQEDKV